MATGDALEELSAFSDFQKVDLQKLGRGEILGERGTTMRFVRGISTQTCFIVMAPVEKTVRAYAAWDVSQHPPLKVTMHRPIGPVAAADDFKSLDLASPKPSFRWLVDKTRATTSERSALNLSREEAVQVAKEMAKSSAAVEDVNRVWREILKARILKFQKEGLLGLPAYGMEEPPITVASEIRSLVAEAPRVAARFSSILSETILPKEPGPPRLDPVCYWEIFDVNGHAVLALGAFFAQKTAASCQIVDCDLYCSNGLYASCILRQIWPVRIQDKEASLVWRMDLVSAPSMAFTKGIERMAAGGLMLQEIKKAVRFFREDLDRSP